MNGADPYLSGEAAYHTISGVQSVGVQANAKHCESRVGKNALSHSSSAQTC